MLIVIAERELEYLVVPVNTWKKEKIWQDDSCLLNEGDHPFIKHKKEDMKIEIFDMTSVWAKYALTDRR